MTSYNVYIVQCGDGSFYTGIATDVERRLNEHTNGVRGAKYLRGRGPLALVYSQEVGDRSTALRAEYRVKQLDREEKRRLINAAIDLADLMDRQETSDA